MKKTATIFLTLILCFLWAGSVRAQDEVTYGIIQDPVDPLMLTAVAYPNFTSNNVTISTALFTLYLPAGTVTDPAIPVLPAVGSFNDITGTWRIEKITPALYSSFGFDPNDLQGNDVYQCILQNSPSPNTTAGQPVSLFSFRLPGDCTGGMVQVHVNDNAIHMALLNNVGININNQMSVSVDDDPSVDLYENNDPNTDNYDCPLDDQPVAVDDMVTTNEDVAILINVTGNDSFGNDGPSMGTITIITAPVNGVAMVDDNGTPNDPSDDQILYTPNANFNGSDVIVYEICDANNDCDQATVTITIDAVNDLPMVPDTTVTTPEDTPITICLPITDEDHSSFTVTSVCMPDNGTISGLTNPATSEYCVTYTPDPNVNGPDTLCIAVCDAMGSCDTSYVYIDVTPVNDPPVVPDTTVTTPEDTPITICVPITDVDDASFTVTSVCQPDNGTISGLTNPATLEFCVTYTPSANFNGPDTLCIAVCDAMGACDTSFVSIDVTPVNDPPVVPDTTVTTPEDTPITICVPITDVDNATFTVTSVCQPDNGTISGLTDPATSEFCVTYTPNANVNGPDTLCIAVCDAMGACDTSYVSIDVTPVNDPPVANDDNETTPEDTPTTFNITNNDTDVDGMIDLASVDLDPNTPGIQTSVTVAGGTFTYDGAGNVTFTPNLNFNGTATTDYQVCDNGTPLPAQCDIATITVTVTAVNDAPIANDDNATTPEDTPVTFNITNNDTDVDGMIDLASVDLDPNTPGIQTTFVVAGGTFSYDGAGNVTFTPNANFNGTATADYQVCDNGTPLPALCDIATITVTVNALNDPPIANDDNATTPEDTPTTFNITNNDTDVDGMIDLASVDLDPNTPGIQTSVTVAGGTFTYDGAGNVTFTPNLNFNGTAATDYQVCDNGTPLPAQCDIATITVTVTAVNDAPIANDDNATTPEDTPATFNITNNDTDVDGMIDLASVDLDPNTPGIQTTFVVAGGTFSYDGAGNVTFTPNANFNGTATADYQVCDNGTPLPALCDIATITVTVNDVNDPPIANDDNATTPEDTPTTFNITNNDTDVDGMIDLASVDLDPNTPGIQTSVTVAGGTFSYDGAGNVTFTPNADFNGTATTDYQVCDNGTPLPAQCDLATITVTVTAVNDAPIANDDNATTPEDTPATFNITNNDTDVDGMIDLASVDLDPNTPGIQTTFVVAGGTFSYDGAGNVTFTPNANFNGTATADYQVCDNGTPLPALCDIATITVTVNAVNDAPIANDDNATTPEDTPTTFNITNNDTDVDGMIDLASVDLDPNTPGIQTSVTVAGGTFSYDGAGNVTFTPNADFNGTATTDYQVCDNGTPLPAQCDIATITVTVTAVNDAPIANDDNATTPEDTPATFNITNNDTDVDGMIDLASVDLDPNTPGIQTTFVVAGGTFSYDGAGNVTFTPNANFNGTATADYQVCDNGTPLPALCDIATISVTVNALNDAPIANDDNATTPEDTPTTFNITNNDTDVDGMIDLASVDLDPNTPGIQTTVTVAGGTFTYDGAGNVTFTPNTDFNGTATTDYQVCDNGTPLPAQCDIATITVTVTSVNDGPIAINDNATTPEDTPVTVPVLDNDTDVDGPLNPASVVVVDGPENGVATVDPLTGDITYTPDADFVGNDTLVYVVCDSGTPVLCDSATVFFTVTATSVRLLAKMNLQGALYNSPDTLMRDDLRINNHIPVNEPYTALVDFVHVGGGGEMVTDPGTVFANYGGNSIVDWVFIELRDPNDFAVVLATRSALLQRDGDVVDTDGVSPLVFENILPASYPVAIRHRNHLGSMTAASIALTNEGTTIDFTNVATPFWDDNTNLNGLEQVTINGEFALWAGNVNTNTSVVFAGQNNDKDPVFNQIDQAPGNIFQSQSYVYNGYHLGDVNMDGRAIFAGQNNDVDFIFNNVDGHPRNVTRSQSFVIRQQLAE